ncbi:serine hydrolase [Arthrobacter sp. 4R501]|uniref:serine hydrolase n=1 Tax=Arthrobacter sp. 4R501 TaxID=2058886 RepID=UPI000CE2E096|nr:serine hydrolase [Arthrobacter sp. 4R501]
MTTRPLALDDIRDIVTIDDTAIASDGTSIVFTRRETSASQTVTSLWKVMTGHKPRQLTRGPGDRAPRAAADSILFLRDVAGVPQLHRLPDAGEPEPLTDLPLGAGPAATSPDGRRVAFTAPVDRGSRGPGSPIVIDTLDDKVDGRGWIGQIREHIFILELDDLRVRQVTDGEFDAGAPAWSPDGTKLAFSAGLAPDADISRERRAYVIDVDDRASRPEGMGWATGISGPLLWAPDGMSLLAVGTLTPAVGNARILRLYCDGREDVDLTAGSDRNVMPGATAYPGGQPTLTPDGEHILFCARDGGWTHLYTIRLASGECRSIFAEPHSVISGLSVAANSAHAAVVVTTASSFAEVALVDISQATHTVLTQLMAESLPGVELYRPEPRQFEISDGTIVHGWLTGAPDTDGAAPLLLDIHGGPHNAWAGVADDIHLYQQLLIARGWRVLTLNPRGSDGYGEEFLRAVDGEWGRADLRDFLEPIDALVAEGLAHPDQLAVTGYSYGGLSTCALTTHTDRFSAAVAGGLLCDFASIGTQHLPEGFFAKMTSNVSPLNVTALAALSPISRVGRVRTPTLVLHGADDASCPVDQARQWFSALRMQNVPTRLVVYPEGTHVFIANGPVEHRIDYHARVVEWVEQYTRATPRAAPASPAPRDTAYWQRRLEFLSEKYGVPGAQFGIVQLDENGVSYDRRTVSTGATDTSTGERVTDDTIFQIGSISKVWTTMLVMQLVDEGLVELDAPVLRYLPDFALADDPTPAVTIRELLTHTSGIEGDVFTDTGRGDDCLCRYVEHLTSSTHLHPRGARFSYCNSGFVIAGRIVEVLRDMTWDDALRQHLIEPMGLTHTITLPDDVPRFSAAVGHTGVGDSSAPVTTWSITRSMGPAGLILANTDDLLTFAETALREGVTPTGKRVLSTDSARLMTQEHVSLRTDVVATQGWGLGWFLQDWNGQCVPGHDGGTIGQRAYLRLFPGADYALVLLTSGGQPDGLYTELFTDAAAAIDGSVPPPSLCADRLAPAPSLAGRWVNAGIQVDVWNERDETFISLTDRMELTAGGEQNDAVVTTLHPSNVPGVYAYTLPSLAGWEQFRPVLGGAYIGYRFVRGEQS